MGGDVDLHACEAAPIALAAQPLVDYLRVGDTLPEQVVHRARVSRECGGPGLPTAVTVRERLKPWPLMVPAFDLVRPVLR